MSPWTSQNQRFNQQMYGAFPMQSGSYPNATASGSPMNYGAYYPPTTYAGSPAYGSSPSGPAYRGGYPSSTGHTGAQSYTATAGPAYGQYTPTAYYKTPTSAVATGNPNAGAAGGGYGNGNGNGNGNSYTATSGASYNPTYDPALIAAMQNMGFGK
jgi:hypothetical protein